MHNLDHGSACAPRYRGQDRQGGRVSRAEVGASTRLSLSALGAMRKRQGPGDPYDSCVPRLTPQRESVARLVVLRHDAALGLQKLARPGQAALPFGPLLHVGVEAGLLPHVSALPCDNLCGQLQRLEWEGCQGPKAATEEVMLFPCDSDVVSLAGHVKRYHCLRPVLSTSSLTAVRRLVNCYAKLEQGWISCSKPCPSKSGARLGRATRVGVVQAVLLSEISLK